METDGPITEWALELAWSTMKQLLKSPSSTYGHRACDGSMGPVA